MPSVMTTREWPPRPALRFFCRTIWIIGCHGFMVPRLVERCEWLSPWNGTSRDQPGEYGTGFEEEERHKEAIRHLCRTHS